jgi:mono/diheme cytochrome c family protein
MAHYPQGVTDTRPTTEQVGRWIVVLVAGVVLLASSCPADRAATDDEEQIAHGRELYGAHCIDCHGGATGGSITDYPPPHNAEGHTWHHGDCELERIVLEGMPPRPGLADDDPVMPAFDDELSEDDVHAILAHIKTWWEEEQREFQTNVTEQVCDDR